MPAVAAGDFPDPLFEAVVRFVRPRELGPVVQSVAEELAGFQRRVRRSVASRDPGDGRSASSPLTPPALNRIDPPERSREFRWVNYDPPQQVSEYLSGRELRGESMILGGVAGFVTALVAAVIWTLITIGTHFQIGFMAVGLGFAVGLVMKKAGRGHSTTFGVLAAVLALFGCVLGNLFSVCAFVGQEHHVGILNVLAMTPLSAILKLMGEDFSAIDGLFYFLAVSAAYRNSRIE